MTVGLEEKSRSLEELPVRLVKMRYGREAIDFLRHEKVDGVISSWDLEDMKDGRFLKKFKSAKPDVPVIVFVNSENHKEEIKARSIGASVILSDNINDEILCEAVTQVLGLKPGISIKTVKPVKSGKKRYVKN